MLADLQNDQGRLAFRCSPRIVSRRFAALILLVSCLLSSSCNSPKNAHDQKKHKLNSSDQDDKLPDSVTATNVAVKAYSPLPKREIYYVLQAQTVSATIKNKQVQSSYAGGVNGTIYQDGAESCRFSADSAIAEPARPDPKWPLDVLTLTGHVSIHSLKPAGNLFCDQLRAEMASHIIKAKGHVHFDTSNGVVGTLPEAWATQDLKKITSPELFNENL
jgi:hypothetical protein